ncbi:hypothetical protein [Qipengyuania sp. 902]|uniref:hypothetical protein n=1 Tax=Qipengyuania sp. 902 TaxID=3417565 RepID=UPI003EB8AF69
MSNNDSIQQFARSVFPGLSNASVAHLQSLGQQQSISAKEIVKFDGPTERSIEAKEKRPLMVSREALSFT